MRPAALLAILALAALAAGCGGSKTAATTVTVARTTTVTTTTPAGGAGGVADVVARVLPGVVSIHTIDYDGGKGEGSGVVIDRRGVIVTNYHVIRGARRLTVVFGDGRHHKPAIGRVIGTAPERDLAILRVPLADLVPLTLGRSSRLRLGDGVLAIGFPLDLGGPTVTAGIVSGLDRTIEPRGGATLEGLLQTDAAINPGNSGGALVDVTGRLVGINTAAGGGENIGFAIAIDEARPIIDEIQSKPAGRRAWLGVTLDTIDSAAAAVQLGLPPDVRGAVVVAIFADGPAAKAGVHAGDVIVSIDGAPVRSTADVSRATRKYDPGDSITLEVVDSSGPRRAAVTVAKRPATLGG